MKHRNPFSVLLFSIITLGIYDLYWLSNTGKAMNARNTRYKAVNIWVLLSPLVVIIAGIIVAVATSASSSGGAYPGTAPVNSGSMPLIASGIVILGSLLIVAVSFYWFWKYSKAVNEYTEGQMNFPVTFLLLWVLHLIGVVFIQDAFNNHGGPAPQMEQTPPMPVAPAAAMPQTTSPSVAPTQVSPSPMPTPPAPAQNLNTAPVQHQQDTPTTPPQQFNN